MYNTSFYNNIIITAPGKCAVHVRDTSGGYSFKGNCYWSSGAPVKIMWDDKTYTTLAAWRSATGQERIGNSNVGFEIDPMLVAPGRGGTIADMNKLGRLTSYRLRVDSPLINSGLDLKTKFGIDSGSRDFFNNALPQGKGQDIGAHEIILENNQQLHVAAASGNINKVKELISARVNVNEIDKYNQKPVDIAIRHSHKEVVELLAAKGTDFSIHLAAYLANVEKLRSLIENNSDVNRKNKDGQTSLHLAARSGHKEVVGLLIAKGAIVNEEDEKNSLTPLHYAARFGHIEVAKLLIAEGSRINARDDHGFIPLHWAALCNRKQLVELLLAKGAQVNAKDKLDRTALYYCCMFREADTDIIELLLANGADVNAGSWPSLYVAVHNDNIALAEHLIDHGTNVNTKFGSDSQSGTVLQLAPYVSSIKMVELLIAKGADVNAGPWTALHGAVEERRRDIVELLIRKGADVNAKSHENKTALWYAKEIGLTEIVELLRKHGAKAVQKQQKKK
jgi:cytohesin